MTTETTRRTFLGGTLATLSLVALTAASKPPRLPRDAAVLSNEPVPVAPRRAEIWLTDAECRKYMKDIGRSGYGRSMTLETFRNASPLVW